MKGVLLECWSTGVLGERRGQGEMIKGWSGGVLEMKKNKNRGYQKLRFWNDAINYYNDTEIS